MTSRYDDSESARLRELLDSATSSIHADPDLANRSVAAHRRRRRRLLAVLAGVTTVFLAGGTSLAVTLPGGHHNRSVVAIDNASPSPTSTPTSRHDICGPARPGEASITPTGGSPYLSSPPPARGGGLPIAREAALRTARSSAPDLLKTATVELRQVRSLGPKGTCITSVDWVVYDHPDPLTVPMGGGGVNSTCVAYVLVNARTGQAGGETIECTSHPAADCPTGRQTGGIGGGAFHSYGQAYEQLPATGGAWTKLPNSPLSTRYRPIVVWTDNRLIVWGGEVDSQSADMRNDGASYDPATRRWTMLPPAPISGRLAAAAVWTGTELVIWGGYDDVGINHFHVATSGAAYNPQTRTWRLLPNSPLKGAHDAGIAWTGTEVVIVDGQPALMTNTVRSVRQAASWNPSTDRWRTLPRQPAGTPAAFNVTVAHWAGDRLLVFHSYDVGGDPSAVTADSYDPGSNSWTHLHKCDGAGYVVNAYDLDGQVLVPPFGDASAFLYSPQHNTWTPTAAVPLSTDVSALTPDGRLLILTGSLEGYDIKPGDSALWDPRTDTWAKSPRLPVNVGDETVAVQASNAVLIWTGDDSAQLYAFTP